MAEGGEDDVNRRDEIEMKEVLLIDPFLKEALQNQRHRLTTEVVEHSQDREPSLKLMFAEETAQSEGVLFVEEYKGPSTSSYEFPYVTVLRMELDVQSFMQNPDQQLFEFPHFPTSYLRLAAHRVAQHYGLQSMVVDNLVDGLKTRIMVKKTPESKLPPIRLSEVPTEQQEQQKPQVEKENDKLEQVKISIKQRSQNSGLNGANGGGAKHSTLKTMEERKEEYDRARARIFNSSSSSSFDSDDLSDSLSQTYNLSRETSFNESDKARVAILRDREKDRSDPDYDRSYERYVRGLPPSQSFNLTPYNMQNYQPAYVQYDTGYPQHGVLPRTQASSVGYGPSNHIMNPFCAVGSTQTSGDSLYMQCPSLAMMYTHSYEQVRHAVFQAPIYHQPVCYNYTQNY